MDQSIEISPEVMPHGDGSPPGFEHLLPVLHLLMTGASAQDDTANLLVPLNHVLVHHSDYQLGVVQFGCSHCERECLIKHRIQRLHAALCLVLVHFPVLVQVVNLHVRICKPQYNKNNLLKSQHLEIHFSNDKIISF